MASADDASRDAGEPTPSPIVSLPAWWGPIASESEQLRLAAAECNFQEFCNRIGFDEEELLAFVDGSTQRHRYLVCGSLSKTRFSWVYLALDLVGDRPVVLKISTREIEPEGRALTRLSHPHVVTVLDMLVFAGYPTLVLEWCSQGDLASFTLAANDWRNVLARGLEAGRGLVFCHERGVVHGDVKPANTLVARGVGKLADLGLARSETREGPCGGTKLFAPPEQYDGGVWTTAGDVYSFARTLEWVLENFDELTKRAESLGEGPLRERVPEAVFARLAMVRAEDPKKRPPLPTLIADLERMIVDTERANLERARWDLEKWRRRVYLQAAVVGMAALVTMGSVTLAAQCLGEPEPGTTQQAVETTLKQAAESVERGGGESTVQYLEAARARAREDADHDAELSVADEAVHLGERLAEQGDIQNAMLCWDLALAVFSHLGDRRRIANLNESAKSWGVTLGPTNPGPGH